MEPSSPHYPRIDFRRLYDRFDAPVTEFDCGLLCAPHNPSGLPFCCDICQAVPVAYRQEWEYLRQNTGLWHPWQGSECPADPADPADLREQTPDHMVLLACQGPAHCQRNFRAVSCRQFPFFPYITADDRFLGLACEWEFENMCWVISHLETVTRQFRQAFIQVYDEILALWPEDYESYAGTSEQLRAEYASRGRRIPLLHRNGGYYLLSPRSERLYRVPPERLPRHGPYREDRRA